MGQKEPERKLSRTTLTFYIVALFSVAIALIMISYVAQSKANKQLESLSTQLSEQQHVAQGAAEKMDSLQKQYDEQSAVIENVREALGSEQAKSDIVGAAKRCREEREVYSRLTKVYGMLLADGFDKAAEEFSAIQEEYGLSRLDGTAEDPFSDDVVTAFTAARDVLQASAPAAQETLPDAPAEQASSPDGPSFP